MSRTTFTEGQTKVRTLTVDRKVTVWTRETIEYDADKYTEKEFIKEYDEQLNGKGTEPIYESTDLETLLDTEEDITPEENNYQPTLEILNDENETIYNNKYVR